MGAHVTNNFPVTGSAWIPVCKAVDITVQVISLGAIRVKLSDSLTVFDDTEIAGLVLRSSGMGPSFISWSGLDPNDALFVQAVDPDAVVEVCVIASSESHPGSGWVFE